MQSPICLAFLFFICQFNRIIAMGILVDDTALYDDYSSSESFKQPGRNMRQQIRMLSNFENHDNRRANLNDLGYLKMNWNKRWFPSMHRMGKPTTAVKLSHEDQELEHFCAQCFLEYGFGGNNDCEICYSTFIYSSIDKRNKPASKYWHSRAG